MLEPVVKTALQSTDFDATQQAHDARIALGDCYRETGNPAEAKKHHHHGSNGSIHHHSLYELTPQLPPYTPDTHSFAVATDRYNAHETCAYREWSEPYHVAGTIPNKSGIVGVVPGVWMDRARVLPSDGGDDEDGAWIATSHLADRPVIAEGNVDQFRLGLTDPVVVDWTVGVVPLVHLLVETAFQLLLESARDRRSDCHF